MTEPADSRQWRRDAEPCGMSGCHQSTADVSMISDRDFNPLNLFADLALELKRMPYRTSRTSSTLSQESV
ncbi:MAG: hypothetical protein OSB00_09370, partial [Sphingomonas bacterium]|nr:hypothetical protein [Sphingomonas bacterium]